MLGDGWYGLWRSPQHVREAVADSNAFGRRTHFEVAVRVKTRIGDLIADGDRETTLQGQAYAILDRLQHYTEAGVDRVVVEPVATELEAFLSQLEQFAYEVAPRVSRAIALQSA